VLDALENIDAYRKFGPEARFIATQLDLNKAHFLEWADRVGIDGTTSASATLRDEHHPMLDDPAIGKLVQRSLLCMKERLEQSETAMNFLGLADLDDDTMLPLLTNNSGSGSGSGGGGRATTASRTHKGANPFKSPHPVAASRKTKLGWAFLVKVSMATLC
jgi:hypothetical protein